MGKPLTVETMLDVLGKAYERGDIPLSLWDSARNAATNRQELVVQEVFYNYVGGLLTSAKASIKLDVDSEIPNKPYEPETFHHDMEKLQATLQPQIDAVFKAMMALMGVLTQWITSAAEALSEFWENVDTYGFRTILHRGTNEPTSPKVLGEIGLTDAPATSDSGVYSENRLVETNEPDVPGSSLGGTSDEGV